MHGPWRRLCGYRGDEGQGNVGGSGGPRTIRVVTLRTPWEGDGAADSVGPGRQGADAPRPRSRGRGEATGRAWVAWGALGRPGEGAKHAEHAWAAGRTWRPGAEGGTPEVGRMALPCRGGRRRGGGVPGARALALGQEGTRDGTPQPIVPDRVDAWGPHVRPAAAETRLGWEGHGVPTSGLSVLRAQAALASRQGAPAVVGEREAGDRAAQVRPDVRGALPSRLAGAHPPGGPDRLGQRQSGAVRTPQIETPSAHERREGRDRPQGGRTGGPPRGSVSGDSTSGDQAVDVRLVGQGPGPGVPHPPPPHQTAHSMRVRSTCDARWGRCPEQDSVAVLWRLTDALPTRVGHGADPVNGGDRPACLPALCPPRRGVLTVAWGPRRVRQAWETSGAGPQGSPGHRGPPRGSVRPWTRSSRARRWLGRRPAPTRSTEAGPSHRKTSAPSGRRVLRHAHRSALSAVMVACTRSKVGAVRGVEPAVGLGLWWPSRSCMTRRDTPAPRGEWPRRAAASGWRPLWQSHARAPPLCTSVGGKSGIRTAAGAGPGTPRGGAARAARTPATTLGAGGAVARSDRARLGPGILVPAAVARRGPRPAAASLPAGAARRHRSSADTSGRSGVPPAPAGAGPPADSTRPAALGSSGGARGRRLATAAAAGARRSTGAPRGAYGRCAPRPASHCAGPGNTGGAPLR